MSDWRQILAEVKARRAASAVAAPQQPAQPPMTPEEVARLHQFLDKDSTPTLGEGVQDFAHGLVSGATSVVPDIMSAVGVNKPAESVR